MRLWKLVALFFCGALLFASPLLAEEDDLYDDYSVQESVEKPLADPLYYLNKGVYYFNDKLYFWFLKPVDKVYITVVPKPARTGIKNFFYNLAYPFGCVNCVLQGKFREAGVETGIFFVNTVYGGLGFTQRAQDDMGWENSNEDFGQTLASYSAGGGIYLVLPVFGPSNLRDGIGIAADTFLSPFIYFDDPWVAVAASGLNTVNNTSLQLGSYEALKNASVDPYQAMKDAYQKLRDRKINE